MVVAFRRILKLQLQTRLFRLLKYGLGIGFVPEQFLASEDDIRVISLNEPIPTREIVLVKKKGHTLPLPAKELIDMIKG